MVALPVVNSGREALDGLVVLGSALSLINLIDDALSGIRARLEFVIVRISGRGEGFD
jgi:hypothetical protein